MLLPYNWPALTSVLLNNNQYLNRWVFYLPIPLFFLWHLWYKSSVLPKSEIKAAIFLTFQCTPWSDLHCYRTESLTSHSHFEFQAAGALTPQKGTVDYKQKHIKVMHKSTSLLWRMYANEMCNLQSPGGEQKEALIHILVTSTRWVERAFDFTVSLNNLSFFIYTNSQRQTWFYVTIKSIEM